MKKAYLFLLAILIGVFAVFTALDYRGNYASERKLWRINNVFAKAARDPKIIPEATFIRIVNEYEQFIKDYPDSTLLPVAHILTGRVYMIKKDYTKARNIYEEVVKIYHDKPNIAVEVVADIGRTYALEENVNGVIGNYKRVIQDYPTTQIGLQAPILLTKLYSVRGDAARTEEAYKQAVEHYKKLINDNPNDRIEFDALRSLGTLYLTANQKRKAVETFGRVLIKFPQKEYLTANRVTTLIKTINTVSIVDLKDYDLPISIYEEFIKVHPGHPFVGSFKDIIESVKLLKDSKLTIDGK